MYNVTINTSDRERVQLSAATLGELCLKYAAWRDASEYGVSNGLNNMRVTDGKTRVGFMSYNGRIWPGTSKTWTSATKPLYDPLA